MNALNSTQRRMIAGSLEIDGRPDIAAIAVVAGNVAEFKYRADGSPASSAAVQLKSVEDAVQGAVTLLGLEGTIKALRSLPV